jgi:hypothetical protein
VIAIFPERQNIKIIQAPGVGSSSAANPFLLSADEEKAALSKHSQYKKSLRIPRRLPWAKSMTAAEVDKQEREAFLNWQRGLAMFVSFLQSCGPHLNAVIYQASGNQKLPLHTI